jgi:hypothetical protein
MRVLTVYAHPSPASLCHAVLERFTQGLSFFAHESVPAEIWDEAGLRERMVAGAGGPVRRAVARRWLRDKRLPELLDVMARQRPKDVLRAAGEGCRS